MATNRTVEREVLDRERQFWQSMQDKDADRAASLTDEFCLVAGAEGIGRVDRKTLAEMVRASAWKLHTFTFSDIKVSMLGDDVVVLVYKVHEELTLDGQRLTRDAADLSTWVRRDGQWLCAAYTEALLGNPFGRERSGAEAEAEADDSSDDGTG